MKARDLMTADPACCTPDDTAQTAVRLMEGELRLIPVVEDRRRRLVGVITDRDIALRGVGAARAGHAGQRADVDRTGCCSPDDDLSQVNASWRTGRSVVPVIDGDGRCPGIIAQAISPSTKGATSMEGSAAWWRRFRADRRPRAETDVGILI